MESLSGYQLDKNAKMPEQRASIAVGKNVLSKVVKGGLTPEEQLIISLF